MKVLCLILGINCLLEGWLFTGVILLFIAMGAMDSE